MNIVKTIGNTDIGLRMLTPRELARAQGFPDGYIFDPIVNGRPLTQKAQVAAIGNSVPPAFSDALVRANVDALAEIKKPTSHRKTIPLWDMSLAESGREG